MCVCQTSTQYSLAGVYATATELVTQFSVLVIKTAKTFSSCFLTSIILTGNDCFVIIIALVFTHSFPFHSIFQFQLFYQSCPGVPLVPLSVAQGHLQTSRRELPVPNTLKSPHTSTASLIRYSLYKLHTIGDKHHPFLSHLPIFAVLVSPWSSGPLLLWSMYNLQTSLLSS